MGPDFPPERFLRTPTRTITWLLKQLDDERKLQANVDSVAVARLTHVVLQIAHGFSGSKRAAPKTKPENFLPFPEWRPGSAQADGPDQPTKFVLSELLRGRRIPIHVFAALSTPVERRT